MLLLRSQRRWIFPMAAAKITAHLPAEARSPKRSKSTMQTEDNPFKQEFDKNREYIDRLNEKRERLVKASRDVTQNSKKVIFQVHRIGKNNKEAVLKQAERDLSGVASQYLSRVVSELQGNDNEAWKLRRAYSPGIQEYVEAATVVEFCKSEKLLTLADLNNDISKLSDSSSSPFKINMLDYLLGIGDLTGELMRLAISRLADGEVETATKICNFIRDLYKQLTLVAPIMDDNFEMNRKMETMLQSLTKVENACYNVRVRGSENIPEAQGQHYTYAMTLAE